MGDSSRTPSIHGQLSTLLGREVKQLRKTDTDPPRVSIYDVISAVTGMDGNHAGKAYRDLVVDYPEVHSIGVNFKFPGRGQRNTPIADVRGIVEIIMLLPGHTAARVRRQAAELLCRYLGGDPALVAEVCRNRGLREGLAVQNPEDPREAGGQKQPPPVLEFDDALDDNEDEPDDDAHEADDADDSSTDCEGEVAVGDLGLSQEQHTQAALANHTPTLGWRTVQPSGTAPPPAPPPVYDGYFERQIQSRCGLHALNNAIGRRLLTPVIMRAACDRYLGMYPSEDRIENEKPSGWYSMNVMVLAVENISKMLAARHETYYDLRWESLYQDPGVIHQCGASAQWPICVSGIGSR